MLGALLNSFSLTILLSTLLFSRLGSVKSKAWMKLASRMSRGVDLEQEAAQAIAKVSLGDLRKAITSLQVAASLDLHVTRELVYETTATAPPEELHGFFLACKEDGFQPARRRMRGILDRFGLAGTDLVNQLHRELGSVTFLDEKQ